MTPIARGEERGDLEREMERLEKMQQAAMHVVRLTARIPTRDCPWGCMGDSHDEDCPVIAARRVVQGVP